MFRSPTDIAEVYADSCVSFRDTCPPETVADSAVDGGCTAPQVTVSDENAPHKSVRNVDDEAVAVFDDDLDTELDASAFIGAMEDAALRFDSGKNAPKSALVSRSS